jgi:leucyl-tRNA synthetase
VPFKEPWPRLLNQGMVIMGGSKMSKTRGNLVEPMPRVQEWGADTIRVTMLFANRPEDDIDWADVSPKGVREWLERVWRAVWDATERDSEDPEELRRLTHRTVKRVGELYERFRFNVAVARLMELTNEIRRTVDAGGGAREAARALVLLAAPIAPFITEELWREALGEQRSVHMSPWPQFDEELAREETVTLVVQVDGKVRDTLEVSPDIGVDEAERLGRESEKVRRALGDTPVTRVVARPPRLVNLVTR